MGSQGIPDPQHVHSRPPSQIQWQRHCPHGWWGTLLRRLLASPLRDKQQPSPAAPPAATHTAYSATTSVVAATVRAYSPLMSGSPYWLLTRMACMPGTLLAHRAVSCRQETPRHTARSARQCQLPSTPTNKVRHIPADELLQARLHCGMLAQREMEGSHSASTGHAMGTECYAASPPGHVPASPPLLPFVPRSEEPRTCPFSPTATHYACAKCDCAAQRHTVDASRCDDQMTATFRGGTNQLLNQIQHTKRYIPAQEARGIRRECPGDLGA